MCRIGLSERKAVATPVTALVHPGRRRDDAAELAGLTGIAVGGVRGDLFVTHVDDANALIDAAVIDVDDVPAAQREDRVDALVLQRFGDQVAPGDHAGVAALALQGIFGGRGFGLNRRGIYGCHVASKFVNLIAGRRCRTVPRFPKII